MSGCQHGVSKSTELLCFVFAGPDGQVPEAITKLGDPVMVDQVCNGVVAAGTGRPTSWDDVAGQQVELWKGITAELYKNISLSIGSMVYIWKTHCEAAGCRRRAACLLGNLSWAGRYLFADEATLDGARREASPAL